MYHTFIYVPLYNGLVYLLDILPWIDAGVAIILFTIIVKLVLSPLSLKAAKTQLNMKQIEPALNELKLKYTDKQEQTQQIMKLYKEKGVNPFVGFFLVLIQLPIIFALYSIFLRSGLPHINLDLLYSFVKAPSLVDMKFLGSIDITHKSVILSLAAAIAQFFQIRLTIPKPVAAKEGVQQSFKDDLARSMSFQMRYIMPVFVFFMSYGLSAVVALYWTVSNLFMVGQELYVRRRIKK